jgi:hypothetical protein
MRLHARIAAMTALGLFLAIAATGLAQRAATPPATSPGAASDTTKRIVAAAQALVATLDDAGRARVQFPFEGPQKTRWSNFPSGIFKREGLRLGDLTPAQRTAVNTLLSTAFSRDGYRKVTEIMRADEALRAGGAARVAVLRLAVLPVAALPAVLPVAVLLPAVADAAGAARAAEAWSSVRTSITSPFSARHPPRRRGCCSSAVITWRSI